VDGDRPGNARFEQEDFGNTIGASLSYNLFSGGLDRAKLNEAKAKQSEAEKTLQDVMIQVSSQVHTAMSKLNSAQNQLVLQRSNTALVRRTRDLVAKEYAAGQGSLVRLNEAQRDLITAQSRLSLALVSLRQAWFDLETVTGKTLLTFAE
jgi:outer membrane protein TolC